MFKLRVSAWVATLFLSVGSAQAADLANLAPMSAAVPATLYNWGGFYVGVQGVYSYGDVDSAYVIASSGSIRTKGHGGGLHAGYNHQIANWVMGVEADIEASGADGSRTNIVAGRDTLEMQWSGSARARIGYAFDRTLIYSTAGVAVGSFENISRVRVLGVNIIDSDKNTHAGWTAGAGVEMALTQNMTMRAEYRYSAFGKKDYDLFLVSARNEPELHSTRIGLSYKF
jgi:outer membrane immunogenic protein